MCDRAAAGLVLVALAGAAGLRVGTPAWGLECGPCSSAVTNSAACRRAAAPSLMFVDRAVDWLEVRLRERRERRERDSNRPERIILVRHGQSDGNANKTAYERTPDSQIALTDVGYAQGVVAGLQIRKLVGDESVRCFYSPYARARQTLLAVLKAFDSQPVELCTEPRLREQDFGNFQNADQMEKVLKERQRFGRFYYRFPNGEAGTDVYDRMASFITYLFRTMTVESDYFKGRARGAETPRNYVLITHGLLMRIFCMCYFRWTVTEFEQVWNPSNCEIWVLQKVPGKITYQLAGRWRASPYGGVFTDITFGENRKERMPEHMKHPLTTRLVTPGARDALDSAELAHLRDVPELRKAVEGAKKQTGRKRPEIGRGDAVLRYWLGEQAIDGGEEAKGGKKPERPTDRKGGGKPFEARGGAEAS